MALSHKVAVLSSCSAVAYLNPDEKIKRCSCSNLNISKALKPALALAAELGGTRFHRDMENSRHPALVSWVTASCLN